LTHLINVDHTYTIPYLLDSTIGYYCSDQSQFWRVITLLLIMGCYFLYSEFDMVGRLPRRD